jgi:hypothetical protein
MPIFFKNNQEKPKENLLKTVYVYQGFGKQSRETAL